MSLRVISAPIGAAIGFAIGGPGGALWGWQIGATAGAILDPQTIKGPSLGDIAAQTSQEGGPIPIVYGVSSPIAGNIISTSPPRIQKKKSGGKGGPKVETETVYRTYAIGICEGPIGGVLRVWRNNTKVYDALDPEFTAPQSDVSEIPGWAGGGEVAAEVPSRNAAFLEKARFFLGTYDQNASPDLEAIHGAGTTPAYRGLAYMVMADEDVTDVGGMVPQWLFQVGSIVSEQVPLAGIVSYNSGSTIRVYDKSGHLIKNTTIPNQTNRCLYRAPTQESRDYALYYSVVDAFGSVGVRKVKIYPNGDVDWGSESTFNLTSYGFASGNLATKCGVMTAGALNYLIFKVRLDGTLGSDRYGMLWIDPETGDGDGLVLASAANGAQIIVPNMPTTPLIHLSDGYIYYSFATRTIGLSAGVPSVWRLDLFGNAGGSDVSPTVVAVGAPGSSMTSRPQIVYQVGNESSWTRATSGSLPYGMSYPESGTPYIPGSAIDSVQCSPASGEAVLAINDPALPDGQKYRYFHLKKDGTSTLIYSPPTPARGYVVLPDRVIFQQYRTGFTSAPYRYVTISLLDGSVIADEVITQPFTDSEWGNTAAQQVYEVVFPYSIDPIYQQSWSAIEPMVADIVADIARRGGIDASGIDTSQLADGLTTNGLVITNQYPAYQAINSLGQVYRFDATKYDGKIRFVPRGGSSVATITEDEMVDESDAPIDANTKRSDAIAIPRVLNLSYYDIDSSGLTPIKQTSERSGDRRAVGDASMQSAVVMDADTAGQAVHIAHAVMIEEQKGELRFALPDSHIKLVPSDPVIVQWQGKSERCRLNQVEILDGYQRYIALRDRQSAYTSEVEGIPPPTIPTPPSRVPGPTVVIPLDIPIVQDADDSVGLSYYVAVCGLTEGWTGAVVELSYDGGANYTQSKSAAIPSIIGKLTTPLPDHPADYPDETNEFTVELFSPGVELADTDLSGMMNRINLAAVGNLEDGWELINFADVTEVDPELRHWTISSLLRGRRGTETRAHAVDEVVVLLDRNLVAMESANITDIGKTLTFRATSNGATTDTGTVVSVDYSGWSQKERKPAYLVTERDVNDLHATWQGVGRMGGGASAMHGLYFSGYRLTAFDQSNASVSLDTASLSATVDVSSLTDPVMAIVQQLNSLTGPSLPVYSQSSALDSDIQRMSEWSVFSVYEGSFIAGKISTTSGQNEMFYSSDAESWTNVPSGQNNLFARPFSILNVGGDWYVKDNLSATSTRFGKKSGGDWHTGEYDWEVVTDLPNISVFGGVPTTDDFVYDGEKFVAIVPGVAAFHQPIFITSDDGLTWEDVPIDIEAYDLPGGETYSLHWDGNGDRWLLFMDMAGAYPNRYGEKRLYQCDADDNFAVWTEISSFRSAFGATTGAGVGRMYVHRLNDSSGDTYVVVTKETDGWVSMKSVDGGDTWTKHAIPVPTIGGGADALHVPSRLVWDGANYITSGRGLIMRSADGETWTHQSITPSPNAPPLPYYALWSNENGVLLRNHASLIVGYSQEILRRSDDSGTTWTFAYSP